MVEPTTAVIIADFILAGIAIWAMISLGLNFPADVKRADPKPYRSVDAIIKIEANRRAYGYTKNGGRR